MLTYLDRNEFNNEPSEALSEVLANFDLNKLCFYTRIYNTGEKSVFSEYLSEIYGVDERQVLLGYGGEDILKDLVHYFLTEDDNKTILLPKYSWWYYKSIAEEVNGISVEYPLYEDGNSYRYDFDAFKDIVKQVKPKMVLLASPNNPTGNMLTVSELENMLEVVGSDVIVVVDEAYASFTTSDNSYINNLINKYPNLAIVRTLSKFYGLPGLRLGFSFVGKKFCDKFLKFTTKYLGYNRISEELGITVMKATEHYRKVADKMREECNLYYQQIRPLAGFKVYDSYANFILIKYPTELKDKLNQALLDKGYQVKFMNEKDINTHMRITLGTPKQNQDVRDVIIEVANQNK